MLFEYSMLAASTLVVLALAWGLACRRQTRKHMKIMIGCLIADVIIVLAIEIQRNAIAQTQEEMPPLLAFHVWVSLIFVLNYIFALFSGIRLFKTGKGRKAHKINAGIFIVCRLLNYITSFMI